MKVEVVQFSDVRQEIAPLTEKHWGEVPFGTWGDLGLNLNDKLYLLAEEEGYLRCIVVRDEGKIVGYIAIMTSEMSHHAGVWQASTDVVYVDPEYRSRGVAKMLFDACRKECEENGIDFFSVNVNPNYDFSSMMEKLGATLTEKTYTWRL